MAEVIGTLAVTNKLGHRFRANIFGKQILQVGTLVQDWDTNTGRDDGPEYVNWRDANRYEAESLVRDLICFEDGL